MVRLAGQVLRCAGALRAGRAVLGVAILNLLAAALGQPAAALAAEIVTRKQTAAPINCATLQHHQLDFWVRDWRVFDANTNQLVAFDRVVKHSEGYIVEENLTFLNDMYRRPGAKVRLAEIVVNRVEGESWVQMWVDNQW